MNKERLKLWVDALRSGRYLKGHGKLNRNDKHFCCLGVLCEVAMSNGLDLKKEYPTPTSNRVEYNNFSTALPFEVKSWIDPNHNHDMERFCYNMIQYNDEGMTFDQIANHIEQYYMN